MAEAVMKDYTYMRDLGGKQLSGYEDGDYKITITTRAETEPLITKHHYSHTMPRNSKYHFLVYYRDKLEGALCLGYGIRPKIKTSWGDIKEGEMLEFDRMWLSDVPPKTSESKVIGMMVKLLRKLDRKIRYLLSYSDGTVGNTGTIYKASNFKELPPLKADFYILADGTRVHPVSMYHRHKTRAWEAMQRLYPGIKKAEGKQYRFLLRI